MNWEEFKALKEQLMKVTQANSQEIGKNSNSLKPYPRGLVGTIALIHIFQSIKEQDFKDLSYRYILSDEDLNLIKLELESLDNE